MHHINNGTGTQVCSSRTIKYHCPDRNPLSLIICNKLLYCIRHSNSDVELSNYNSILQVVI